MSKDGKQRRAPKSAKCKHTGRSGHETVWADLLQRSLTWIVNENWLNYMDYHDRKVSVPAMLEGYGEILEVLRPYLCADPQQITHESYLTIERLATQAAATQAAEEAPDRVAV